MLAGNSKTWLGADNIKEFSFSDHTHSSDDITSGILPLTRGGTSVTSITELKNLLDISTINSGQLQVISYKGNGEWQYITFDFTPIGVILLVAGSNPYIGPGTLIWGSKYYYFISGGDSMDMVSVSYSGNTLNLSGELNYSGNTYVHIAFG